MLNSFFRRVFLALAMAAFSIMMLATVASANAVQVGHAHPSTGYTFTTLNDNADPTFNQLLGINDHGEISGYFGSGLSGHPNKGYTIVAPYGQNNYTDENFPGSVQTQVTGLNNLGDTVGFWVNGTGKNLGFVEWNGVFTSYKNPNTGMGTVNQLLGINDKGIAVGFYTDANNVNHAYKLNQATGKFSAIVPPNSMNGAVATGINDNGDIVGFVKASDGTTFAGFLYKGGHYTEFDFPGSTNTTPFGVNQNDQIVGVYVDSNNAMHGFLLSSPLNNAHWKSIDDPNGIGTTTVNGINDKGQIVGFYVDAAGNTDGFLATK